VPLALQHLDCSPAPLVAVVPSVAAAALVPALATVAAAAMTVAIAPCSTTRPSDPDRASHVTSPDYDDGFDVGVSGTGHDRRSGADWPGRGHDRRSRRHRDRSPSGHPELGASNDNRDDQNAPLAADRHEQLVAAGVVLYVVVAVEVPVLRSVDNHVGAVVVVESAVDGASTCDNLNCEYSVDNC